MLEQCIITFLEHRTNFLNFEIETQGQGGIFIGSQTHTKFLQQFTLFCRKFKVFPYFLSNEGFLPITHNINEILIATGRNFLSQKEISYQGQKFLVTRRNFLLQEKVSCHRKKFLVAGRNFLLQEELSCHRKKFLVTG